MTRAADRAERIERLRAEARRRTLDGVLVFSWRRGVLGWFCGYSPGFVTNCGALWIPVDGVPVVGVRHPYEEDRASRVTGLRVVAGVTPEDLLPAPVRRIGWVGGDFVIDETPLPFVAALAQRHIEMVDLKSEVDEWRVIKSQAELHVFKRTAAIGEIARRAAGAAAMPGDTDFAIAARVEAAARTAGAFRVNCLVGIGDGVVVTEAHGNSVRPGDPVGLEINFEADNAYLQTNGTLLPPNPQPHQVRAVAACEAVRRTLVAELRPGTAVDDIVTAGDRRLADFGLLEAKEYDFGHGVGADTPEHPRLVYGTGRRIEAGMVLAVHVAVRRPGAETAFIGGPVVVDETSGHELADGKD